ncbi:hypothetical protein BJ508DRAFT_378993 [Ascobolus immersus RN42]|uniref:Uncharacterized protein n=1 Tax=Ascobolus immersus RN42 TaxID=1160509 RepID=A0A3N4HVH7_ASCIM|nr:hypothetical protein BJ508DRAFT_378993 [Ascobolus immersus RN42]
MNPRIERASRQMIAERDDHVSSIKKKEKVWTRMGTSKTVDGELSRDSADILQKYDRKRHVSLSKATTLIHVSFIRSRVGKIRLYHFQEGSRISHVSFRILEGAEASTLVSLPKATNRRHEGITYRASGGDNSHTRILQVSQKQGGKGNDRLGHTRVSRIEHQEEGGSVDTNGDEQEERRSWRSITRYYILKNPQTVRFPSHQFRLEITNPFSKGGIAEDEFTDPSPSAFGDLDVSRLYDFKGSRLASARFKLFARVPSQQLQTIKAQGSVTKGDEQ